MTADSPEPSLGGIELAPGVRILEDNLRFQFAHSSGPGGQNVNKLNTKAELWVRPDALIGLTAAATARLRSLAGKNLTLAGEIHLVAQTSRRQEANRAQVLEKLREMIVKAQFEPRRRRKTKPSRAAKQRRLESKRHRGEIKSGRRGSFDD